MIPNWVPALVIAWTVAILFFVSMFRRLRENSPRTPSARLTGRDRERKRAEVLLTAISSEPYETAVSSLALALAICAKSRDEPLAAVLKRAEDAWFQADAIMPSTRTSPENRG